jgi:hypothetical protein
MCGVLQQPRRRTLRPDEESLTSCSRNHASEIAQVCKVSDGHQSSLRLVPSLVGSTELLNQELFQAGMHQRVFSGICCMTSAPPRPAGTGGVRLWPWSRGTAWTRVAEVMKAAKVQKCLGHAQLSTTAIYADASGLEATQLAARMW